MPLIVLGGIIALIIAIAGLGFLIRLVGVVRVDEEEVGIIIKKLGGKRLPAGRLIALEGEAGIQAETLAPGMHFYPGIIYSVKKVRVTRIRPGEIGLVVAADGQQMPPGRILGKVVDSDNFQDAVKFLQNGGEKGRQLGLLTTGAYRINTELFSIITSENAAHFDLDPALLRVYEVETDHVGIVTTLDGRPIEEGEIAGPIIPGHDNFQDAHKFIASGGRRGLQEQVLLSGSWNLNPWFVNVEQFAMTEIPIGHVGVVISYVGEASQDVSGVTFTHGDLVEPGHKGVWVTPMYPGKHPLNIRVMKVELVPTTNIVLNWAKRAESHNYDSSLSSITVTSKDGFTFDLEVSQIIHVGALDAPKVISRIGTMQNLVDHVLEPIVSNYFRNAAQAYTVLDFLTDRTERQKEATQHVSAAIRTYDVQAIDTLVGKISPPEELMQTLTDRKIAEEQRKTYTTQQEAQQMRQQLVRETAQADIQQDMVRAERNVEIAELKARSEIKQAEGDAEATRLRATGEAESIEKTGEARAESYRMGVEALGTQGFTALQLMQIIGERNVRIIPEITVGGQDGNGGMVDGLLGMLLLEQLQKKAEEQSNGHMSVDQ